jgi:hypothetical protein
MLDILSAGFLYERDILIDKLRKSAEILNKWHLLETSNLVL